MKDVDETSEICPIPRWQLIKSSLNNLDYSSFVAAANSDSEAILIDVRTETEHKEDHLPNSTLVDYLDRDLASKIEALNPNKHYYVYCRTGRRSLRVCVIMKNLGFKNVFNLEGGIASQT